VHSRMDGEARGIDGIRGVSQSVAVGIDLDEARNAPRLRAKSPCRISGELHKASVPTQASGTVTNSVTTWTTNDAGVSIASPREPSCCSRLPDNSARTELSKGFRSNTLPGSGPYRPVLPSGPTVRDGSQAAAIALLGNYMATSFVTAGVGHGGTLFTEGSQTANQLVPLTTPHTG
jgi:hypothetical protein